MSERVVFIVTSGEYSDYGIRAVFSTRELAEAHAAWLNGPDESGKGADVEEWTLDVVTPHTGCCLVTGTLEQWMESDGEPDRLYTSWEPEMDLATERPSASLHERTYPKREEYVWVVGVGKDREHALRSGREIARAVKAGSYIPRGSRRPPVRPSPESSADAP